MAVEVDVKHENNRSTLLHVLEDSPPLWENDKNQNGQKLLSYGILLSRQSLQIKYSIKLCRQITTQLRQMNLNLKIYNITFPVLCDKNEKKKKRGIEIQCAFKAALLRYTID